MKLPPLRSWLYAPGNNAKLLDRVFTTGTDAVVLDLEDAVPASEKANARAMVKETLASRAGLASPAVFVRINAVETGLAEDDIKAIIRPGIRGIRIPKVEDPLTVQRVAGWIELAEVANLVPIGSTVLVLGIETALGVWRAREIASANNRALALSFGTVDFIRDLNMSPESEDGRELLFARSQLVLASRVARVAAPIGNVYTKIDDVEGLEREARADRALGFFGKSCIHPRQIEVVNRVFTPTEEEVSRARAIVEGAAEADQRGVGAIRLSNGDFVDIPVVRRAEAILRLAEQLNGAKQPAEPAPAPTISIEKHEAPADAE